MSVLSFPGGSVVRNLPKCRRCRFEIPWRKKWQPTPVFLPGKIPWTEDPGGVTVHEIAESDMT